MIHTFIKWYIHTYISIHKKSFFFAVFRVPLVMIFGLYDNWNLPTCCCCCCFPFASQQMLSFELFLHLAVLCLFFFCNSKVYPLIYLFWHTFSTTRVPLQSIEMICMPHAHSKDFFNLFFHFSFVPNMFPSSSQLVPIKFSICSLSSQCVP